IIELAFVLVGPLLEDVMRSVPGARGPINEERLIGRIGTMPFHPSQRVVSQVGGEVVLGVVRRLDGIEVFKQPGLPLRGFAGEKSVEIVEANAFAGWPKCKRAHGRGLGRRSVVPLTECSGVVSVVAES